MDVKPIWAGVVGVTRRVRDSGMSINAAAVAYNAFLALVPLAFALLGVAAAIGQSSSAVRRVDQALDPLVPGSVKQFILDLFIESADRMGSSSILLVLGSVIIALFLGSRAVAALQKSLAAVGDTTERRPPVEMRLVAVGLTIGGGLVLVLTSIMLLVGRTVVAAFGNLTGLTLLDELWLWLRVPIAAMGVFAFLLALYQLGPPRPLKRSWLAALVATGGAVLGSLAFGLYLSVTPELGATIGVLGGVAIALIWLYVGAMAILFGAVTADYVESMRVKTDG